MSKILLNSSLLILISFLLSCENQKETVVLSSYNNGQPQEIIELDGRLTKDSVGLRKLYFENGELWAFGRSENGKRHGKWTCYYPDGKPEWIATLKDGIQHGEMTCYKMNGDWWKNDMVNGIKHGKYVSYFYENSDSVYCYVYGQYVKGLEQGLWIKKDTSGILLVEMTYVDGETLGYFTNRYKNGRIRLKGEMPKDGSMKNFTFYDEKGIEKKQDTYILRKI